MWLREYCARGGDRLAVNSQNLADRLHKLSWSPVSAARLQASWCPTLAVKNSGHEGCDKPKSARQANCAIMSEARFSKMKLSRVIARLSWGLLVGAFVGCLVGIAEFASDFLKPDTSYAGNLSLAYKHIVFPYVALGVLVGMTAAICATLVEWVRSRRGKPARGIRVTFVAIFLGLTSIVGLVAGILLATPRNTGKFGILALFVGSILVAGVLGFIASRVMRRLDSSFALEPRKARTLRFALSLTLIVMTATTLVVPPKLLISEADPVAPRALAGPRKPHVIFVMVDTLRADHLSMYGYSRRTSPNLERLAATGVVFSQAAASSSWTKPSVASLFTSLHPSVHQAKGNQDFLSGSLVTMAEILRDAGFITLGVTANPLISPTFGFTQGFMDFNAPETISPFRFTTLGQVARELSNRLRTAERRDQQGLRPSERTAGVGQSPVDSHAGDARSEIGMSLRSWIRNATTWVADRAFGEKVGALPPGDGITEIALRMVDRNRGAQSLFLYVHYIDPHDPYSPPPPFDQTFSY